MIDTAFFYLRTVEDHLIHDETMPQPALILRHSCAGIWIVRSGPTGNRKRQTPADWRRQQMKAAHPAPLEDSKTGARDVPLGASAHRYINARRKPSKEAQGLVFPLPQPSPYEAVRKV